MAVSMNMDLIPMIGFYGADGYFKTGQILTIGEVKMCLESRRDLHDSGDRMKRYIQKTQYNEFFKIKIDFPISKLHHVTDEFGLRVIMHSGYFTGSESEQIELLQHLSFWSVEIHPENSERARQQAYETVKQMVTAQEAEYFQEQIKGQYANSPAFDNTTSRYGNFVFSFPLSDLLEAYKSQHCQNVDPQLRVLGTQMYRQEIAHIIVVHSPGIDLYDDFPMVQTVPSTDKSLPFVYWRKEDGELCWRPESTSTKLQVEIRNNTTTPYNSVQYCVWNHLIFAFHLPEGQHLVIPREKLQDNLAACGSGEVILNSSLKFEVAEEIVRDIKG
ncbi:Hypothetical predicted protein [Pelobates cultripes]|uniref:Uncharacterized protein n=1 Tax=Pelobates cultripes TaxID=61616 RepID=A0AAD1SD24_PELCU|nr:Hypothetical predicted protein [Pelobates cultripes]